MRDTNFYTGFVPVANQKSVTHDRSSVSSPNDAADTAIAQCLEAYTTRLRSCCQTLIQYCSRRACCFRSPPTQAGVTTSPGIPFAPFSPPSQPKEASVELVPRTAGNEDGVNRGERLQLEIRGMDCVDCVPKVGRALAQLSSVTLVNLDYFSGIAELQHDPEIIDAAAIANYVARATGFGVKALTASSAFGTSTAIVTLPISLTTIPPPEALDDFDIHRGSNPRVIELSFPAHIDSPYRAREILEKLKPWGATLVPANSEGRQRDTATHVVVVRTTSCAVLSIPVLVLAWANLPHNPTLYGGIAIGLTTVIQGLAFPLFSSAFRSIVYLRQADMSVLVSISTLAAYIFSIVAYAFQVAGRPFATPFFESTALRDSYLSRTYHFRRHTSLNGFCPPRTPATPANQRPPSLNSQEDDT